MSETSMYQEGNINILQTVESLLETNTLEMMTLAELAEEYYRDASGFWRLKNGRRRRR